MTLTVEIIDSRVVSDGHISFLARCNGDPASDSWHTFAINPALSPTDLDAAIAVEIDTHQQRVAKLHFARVTALTKVAAQTGKTKTINL